MGYSVLLEGGETLLRLTRLGLLDLDRDRLLERELDELRLGDRLHDQFLGDETNLCLCFDFFDDLVSFGGTDLASDLCFSGCWGAAIFQDRINWSNFSLVLLFSV